MKSQRIIRLINMQSFVVFVFVLLSFPIHGSSKLYVNPLRYCSDATFSVSANRSSSNNNTYFSNLNLLSSALSANASHKLYHKSSVGRPPNRVYGNFQCRGDLNPAACRLCVATATFNSSQQLCPLSVEAVVWLDECTLRYSNQSFFSVVPEAPMMILWNIEDVGEDVEGFNQRVAATLDDAVAIANASSSSSSLQFGTKEGNFRNLTIFTMAQCSGDLSVSNCGNCLRDALQEIPDCCSGKKGARVLFPSCTVRYELYPFYRVVSSVSTPPVSAPVPPPPAPESAPPPPLPSFPSPPPSSTAAAPLLSGKGRAIVTMVIGILEGYFLL